MLHLSASTSIAIAGAALAIVPALAQTKAAPPPVAEAPSPPVQSSLVVGTLQIGAGANLVVAGIDINVASDRIVYSYFFRNTGFGGTWRHSSSVLAGTAGQR